MVRNVLFSPRTIVKIDEFTSVSNAKKSGLFKGDVLFSVGWC